VHGARKDSDFYRRELAVTVSEIRKVAVTPSDISCSSYAAQNRKVVLLLKEAI
jgi:hypothetical protein